jgi:hypothetical protein
MKEVETLVKKKYRYVSKEVRILCFFGAEIYYANLIILSTYRLNHWNK